MAKRKLDEAYMKQLLADGMPYKPASDSRVSDLDRQKALASIEGSSETKKEKAEAEAVLSEEKSRKAPVKPQKRTIDKKVSEKEETEVPITTMATFRERYFTAYTTHSKMSFLADRELLQLLRRILWDTDSNDVSLSSYVNNILLEHINQHRALINKATAENIRKPTLPEL